MRVTLLLVTLAVLAAFDGRTRVYAEDTKVIKLGKQNWDDALGLVRTRYFLKLYAPWCIHCKRLAPVWESFAGKVQAD